MTSPLHFLFLCIKQASCLFISLSSIIDSSCCFRTFDSTGKKLDYYYYFFFYPPQTYPKNSWFILFIAGSLTLWQLHCVAFVFHGNASHIKIDGWLRACAPDMAFRNSLAGPFCLVMNFQTSWDRRFAIITFQWCVFILSGFKFMVLSYTLGCFGFTCFEGKCVYS